MNDVNDFTTMFENIELYTKADIVAVKKRLNTFSNDTSQIKSHRRMATHMVRMLKEELALRVWV